MKAILLTVLLGLLLPVAVCSQPFGAKGTKAAHAFGWQGG